MLIALVGRKCGESCTYVFARARVRVHVRHHWTHTSYHTHVLYSRLCQRLWQSSKSPESVWSIFGVPFQWRCCVCRLLDGYWVTTGKTRRFTADRPYVLAHVNLYLLMIHSIFATVGTRRRDGEVSDSDIVQQLARELISKFETLVGSGATREFTCQNVLFKVPSIHDVMDLSADQLRAEIQLVDMDIKAHVVPHWQRAVQE